MTTPKVLLTYAVVGVALWPVPLFNIVHVESAAVVAFVAFFVAGWAALTAFNRPAPLSVGHVLATQGAALIVPLALLTVSLLWAPNCDYVRGLGFYALFPGISVVLTVAMAYALSGTGWRFQKMVLAALGVGVAALGPLYDIGLHPQFYTYNHVFGGVLGPIYDEELAVRPGLFAFRGLTLLWAALAFLVGWSLRQAKTGWSERAGIGLLAVLIAGGYAFSAPLGLNTPAWYLQQELGGHRQTEHFDIYYDPDALAAHEVETLARDHEFRYAWLTDQLQMDGPDRIISYLYPDPDTKARLTGARTTSVAPVWLPQPQSHVLLDRYESTFGHELVHVFSRQFGLPILKASWAVGLVEGLAVALEPPHGTPTPREQVSAAALRTDLDADALAERVAARLKPFGFWTGRGAVSYTTMGAFVDFLLDQYGAERLRAVYARANFEAVYGQPVDALAQEWAATLHDMPLIARDAAALVTRRFAQPSLFEQRCPHYVPPFRRAYRAGQAALATTDTTAALDNFARALQRQPRFTAAHQALARIRLARGEATAVITQLDTLAADLRTPSLAFALGDAYVISGQPIMARQHYQEVIRELPYYAHETRGHVVHRWLTADRPDAVRVLVAGDSAAAQAQRLRALPERTPALEAWVARRWMAAGRYGEADSLWNALPPIRIADDAPPTYSGLLHRAQLAWHARSALEHGAYAVAEQQARDLATAFRAIGALNAAATAEEQAQRAAWAASDVQATATRIVPPARIFARPPRVP
jgi:tetratricopeptide (TPR) repeat protein